LLFGFLFFCCVLILLRNFFCFDWFLICISFLLLCYVLFFVDFCLFLLRC
jgi:hypothetical protein